jgi:predicted porin
MNKKLLAVAVGATLAAAPMLSAQAAKVTVYGQAEVEIVDVSTDNSPTIDGTYQGDDNGRSRWGIKAEQDLGNGMKAIAKYEFQLDPSNGDDQVARSQYVGLSGGFGELRLGRDHGAYKTAGGVAWDPYVATFMQARRGGGMSGGTFGHNSFRNDLIGYTTPKGLGGFWGQVQFVVDDRNGDDGDYHLAGGWKGGPLEIIVAANNDDSKDAQNRKIGARYNSGGLTAAVQYEDVENGDGIRLNGVSTGASTADGSFLWVNLGYKFGNNLVSGSLGNFSSDTAASDVDYLAIGVTHFFDKKTRVYGGYAKIDADGGTTVDSADMWGVGIRFDF